MVRKVLTGDRNEVGSQRQTERLKFYLEIMTGAGREGGEGAHLALNQDHNNRREPIIKFVKFANFPQT